MEQIRSYLCLCEQSEMYKECDINRNAWSKVAEKLDFLQNCICRCRYEKLSDCCEFPVAKNQRVRTSLSVAEIHFLKLVSFFEMNGATIARKCSNHLGYIWEDLKIRDEEYLLY